MVSQTRSARVSRIQDGTDGAFAALSMGLPETSSHADLLSRANAESFYHCAAVEKENGKRMKGTERQQELSSTSVVLGFQKLASNIQQHSEARSILYLAPSVYKG